MDTATAAPIRYNRLLPYWAVFQTDLRLTMQSWVYRLWVLMTLVGAGGYIVYKVGVYREAGIVQSAAVQSGDLLRGVIVGSLGLISLLSVGGIAAERATIADSVLCRGISRNQYFLAKWHSRLVLVLATFAVMTGIVLPAHHFLFDPDLTLSGGIAAIVLVASLLALVVSWGLTVGAMSSGTVIGITLFWMLLYGGIVLASLLPEPYPSPERLLARLKFVLRGQYDTTFVAQTAIASFLGSLAAAGVGLSAFRKTDV